MLGKNDPIFLMKDCVVEDIDLHQALSEKQYFDHVDEETFTHENGSKILIKYTCN